MKLRTFVTDRVKGNELFLPMNLTDKDSAINFLIGAAKDIRTYTPAYKQRYMEVLRKDGENPMPTANPRNKKRSIQQKREICVVAINKEVINDEY